jgi:sugar phosphate isomerase/epimerase
MHEQRVFLKQSLAVILADHFVMRFSFLFYEPIPTLAELERAMQRLRRLGYEGVELSACHPMPYPAEAIRKLSERHDLPVVSLCLSVANDAIRRRATERLRDYVSLAGELDALLVVGLMQGVRADEPDEAAARGRIESCLKEVATFANGRGANVVIEPVNHLQVGFHNSVAEAAALAHRIHEPSFGFMLDTLHMNIEERSIEDVIRTHGRSARHVHLCDTHGGPFGTGGLDFRAVLGALRDSGFGGFVSVKVYRGAGWEDAAAGAAAYLRSIGAFSPASAEGTEGET